MMKTKFFLLWESRNPRNKFMPDCDPNVPGAFQPSWQHVPEMNLEDRWNTLETRGKALDTREQDLAQREASLTQRTQQMKQREDALIRQATELKQREDALTLREDALTREEETRQSRQRQLLEEASNRYRREREQWEQTVGSKPDPTATQQVGQGLLSLAEQYKTSLTTMDIFLKEFRSLANTVRYGDRDGVAALCEFHRRLELIPREEFAREAAALAVILRKYYQLEPIEPVLGSRLDWRLCEPTDRTQGEYVVRCLTKGWRRGDEIFTRAVVITAGDLSQI